MRRTSLIAILFAFSGLGLFAQDDLAQYQTHMKAVVAANMAIRGAMASKDTAAISTNATAAAKEFAWIADFFKGKGKDDGVTFAKNAGAAFQAVADAKTPEDMAAAAQKVQPTCGACHAVYRAGSAFKGL